MLLRWCVLVGACRKLLAVVSSIMNDDVLKIWYTNIIVYSDVCYIFILTTIAVYCAIKLVDVMNSGSVCVLVHDN